jgi:hypothetical protein
MQMTPRAASGMSSMTSLGIVAVKHQHSVEPAAMPHAFDSPHIGQRLGSRAGSFIAIDGS